MQFKGQRCCFLDYDENTQFRVYDLATNKIKSNIRDIEFLENEFLKPNEFINVSYVERSLQVSEPRNYTEYDEDLDIKDMTDQFSESSEPVANIHIFMPTYMPAPEIAANAPRAQPQWPIPSPPHPPMDLDSDPDLPSFLHSTTVSQPGSRPAFQHSSPIASQQSSPQSSRPVTSERQTVRQSHRPTKPT